MRKNLGAKSCLYPEPVIVVGTYDESGKADAMTAAWGGISDTNELMLCLSFEHKTTQNILNKKCFTASVGTKDTYIQCDYVGMVSGNDVEDKLDKCGLHQIKAEHIDAPIFEELPFALECELISYDKENGHLFAKIVNVSVDEKVMSNDKVDINKLQPIIFDGLNNTYNIIGEKIGNAFVDYKKIENEK